MNLTYPKQMKIKNKVNDERKLVFALPKVSFTYPTKLAEWIE